VEKHAVSIPHRYGKNHSCFVDRFFSIRRFPFLIGTVRTKKGGVKDGENGEVFPLLIGTVRTKHAWIKEKRVVGFHSS